MRRVALPAAVLAVLIVVQLRPEMQAALEFNRHATAAGQWWRVLTCHLTHWGWPHLAADTAALAALWWLAPGRRRGAICLVAVSFAAVGLAVWAGAGDITTYRGMSGVGYALLGWVLVATAARARPPAPVACVAILAAVAAKVVYETAAPGVLPGLGLPAGVTVVGIAHAAGLLVGASAALVCGLSAKGRALAFRGAAEPRAAAAASSSHAPRPPMRHTPARPRPPISL